MTEEIEELRAEIEDLRRRLGQHEQLLERTSNWIKALARNDVLVAEAAVALSTHKYDRARDLIAEIYGQFEAADPTAKPWPGHENVEPD
ncbi:hypothetical protein [Roseivivax isoporae]|uniref:hypothetical protein n=1 Tax=Roseivivax isoporae TaxID=591206 RepID=UPI0012EC500C|nr:hypothetical protein [Roseivivax isoporae]